MDQRFQIQVAVERAIAQARPRTASVTMLANAAISAYREAQPDTLRDPIAAAQASADALGERLRGISWPCGSDSDFLLPFVERCDEAGVYEYDDDAARALVKMLGGGASVMWAERHGKPGALQPFVYAPGSRDLEALKVLRELVAARDRGDLCLNEMASAEDDAVVDAAFRSARLLLEKMA